MHAVATTLPELNPGWHDSVAAPVIWPRDFPGGVLLLELLVLGIQRFAVLNRLALIACPGRDLAIARASVEIGVALSGADLLDALRAGLAICRNLGQVGLLDGQALAS